MCSRRRFVLVVVGASVSSWVLGTADVRAGAQAPLDPNAFASLGSLTGATAYIVNTGNGISTPTLTEDGSTVLNGVIYNGVAVFDFSNISLASLSTLSGTGALPLILLSRGGATLNGSIDLRANGTTPGPGGGMGGTNGAGGGPGAATGIIDGAEGAGFGGTGGGATSGLIGGPTYGDPTHAFFGGSGGSGSGFALGGGGGGGLEISTLGDISIGPDTNMVDSGILDGGAPGQSGIYNAGGGSGGGVFLATPGQITVDNTIDASGGFGSGGAPSAGGGGGGGGRILFETSNLLASNFLFITANGGNPGGSQDGVPASAGGGGSIDVTAYVPAVPEPGIISILMTGGIPLLLRRRRSEKRRRAVAAKMRGNISRDSTERSPKSETRRRRALNAKITLSFPIR
jgi:hypothetical protein